MDSIGEMSRSKNKALDLSQCHLEKADSRRLILDQVRSKDLLVLTFNEAAFKARIRTRIIRQPGHRGTREARIVLRSGGQRW